MKKDSFFHSRKLIFSAKYIYIYSNLLFPLISYFFSFKPPPTRKKILWGHWIIWKIYSHSILSIYAFIIVSSPIFFFRICLLLLWFCACYCTNLAANKYFPIYLFLMRFFSSWVLAIRMCMLMKMENVVGKDWRMNPFSYFYNNIGYIYCISINIVAIFFYGSCLNGYLLALFKCWLKMAIEKLVGMEAFSWGTLGWKVYCNSIDLWKFEVSSAKNLVRAKNFAKNHRLMLFDHNNFSVLWWESNPRPHKYEGKSFSIFY